MDTDTINTPRSLLKFPTAAAKPKSSDFSILISKLQRLERLRPGALAVVTLLVDDYLDDAVENA